MLRAALCSRHSLDRNVKDLSSEPNDLGQVLQYSAVEFRHQRNVPVVCRLPKAVRRLEHCQEFVLAAVAAAGVAAAENTAGTAAAVAAEAAGTGDGAAAAGQLQDSAVGAAAGPAARLAPAAAVRKAAAVAVAAWVVTQCPDEPAAQVVAVVAQVMHASAVAGCL